MQARSIICAISTIGDTGSSAVTLPIAMLRAAMADSPDAILNFAAESHVDRSIQSSDVFLRTNVIGRCCSTRLETDLADPIVPDRQGHDRRYAIDPSKIERGMAAPRNLGKRLGEDDPLVSRKRGLVREGSSKAEPLAKNWERLEGLGRGSVDCKSTQPLVLFRNDGIGDWPRDGKVGVVPDDPAFALRIINCIHAVDDIRWLIPQDAKAMRKPSGNPQEVAVVIAHLQGRVLTERTGVAAEIDGDVPDAALYHADKFSLCGCVLKMQPSQHSGPRSRVVLLNELSRQPEFFEFLGVKPLHEESTSIPVHGEFNENEPRQI
jgi:hypothetical protein